ncbi:MAG: glycosyltransferase family 4 protein [Patescibacteria group bacterium]|jgi:glycosyltransferase involved in cell wall biosynthesis
MKIAMIGQKGIPVTQGGGVEKHVQELALRLANTHEILVYTRPAYTAKTLAHYHNVRLISLPTINTKHFDAITHTFISIIHATLKAKVDVVHIHSVGPALLAWLPRILHPKTRVVVTFHSMDRQHQKWGWLARVMLHLGEYMAMKFAHEVITVSKALQSYTYESYRKITTYIPNGISETTHQPAKLITSQFGLHPEQYILSVSRLVRHKGIHHLINAYEQLSTDKKLVIVGGSAHTDNYVKELRVLAKQNYNIIFTGNQMGAILEELFSNAYLYVLPSESEGLSLALLEAAAYGKAVLAADIPANEDILKYCGVSFKNANIADLKQQLTYLLANPNKVKQLGAQAQQHVLENYHWKDIVAQTNIIYRKVYQTIKQPALELFQPTGLKPGVSIQKTVS